jgi:hypothetical protein
MRGLGNTIALVNQNFNLKYSMKLPRSLADRSSLLTKAASNVFRRTVFLFAAVTRLGFAISTPGTLNAADLRLGIIGTDTSHVTAFTQLINDVTDKNHISGARVVAAYRGGSFDIPSSRDRVEGYAAELEKKFGVKLVASVEELCSSVDAVLLESVDGRPHLEQVRPVIASHKPVFIDKPLAGSLKDSIEIYRLARENHVPWFTSSAYRYYDSMTDLKRIDVGSIRGAISYGPAEKEPHHPDLFWYGIHATEALYTILGTGCESVSRTASSDTDIVTGIWSDGRTGVLVGLRTGATPHKVTVFGNRGVAEQKGGGDYVPLVREIVKFFQTGVAPIPPEESIELYAFMESADESKGQGGIPVKIADVLAKNGWKSGTK